MNIKNWLISKSKDRNPDFVVGSPEDPYMKRWYLIPRNKYINFYLHNILHDDDDRALHDHRGINLSFILEGSYLEHLKGGVSKVRAPGSVVVRFPTTRHRLEILPDSKPVWTLFVLIGTWHHWGFYCPQGFRIWEEFVSSKSIGEVGKGCD